MTGAIEALAVAVAASSGAAAVMGAASWWLVRHVQAFWVVLRVAQGMAVALALAGGLAAALGRRPDDGLFWVYALTPVLVNVVAEQLRAVSAQEVLDRRGIAEARALERSTPAEQRSVVVEILRREAGVMTLAAGVTCFLAVRALGTAAGL